MWLPPHVHGALICLQFTVLYLFRLFDVKDPDIQPTIWSLSKYCQFSCWKKLLFERDLFCRETWTENRFTDAWSSKETNTGDKLVRPSVLACHSFHHSVAFSIFLSFQNKLNLSVWVLCGKQARQSLCD